MNPLTNVRRTAQMNDLELSLGTAWDSGKSWHQKYSESAWIFVGGLPYDLTEGDIIAIFSQYGEIVNINLIRDHKSGKSKGFGFICYEDQKSTVLAVDNFNGTKVLNRTLRVDHVEEYRVPNIKGDEDEETRAIWEHGCAPKELAPNEYNDLDDQLLPIEEDQIKPEVKDDSAKRKKHKKEGKKKKHKKEKKKKSKRNDSDSDKSSPEDQNNSQTSSIPKDPIPKPSQEKVGNKFDRGFDSKRWSPARKLSPGPDRKSTNDNRFTERKGKYFDREGDAFQKRDSKDGPPTNKKRYDNAYVPSRYR